MSDELTQIETDNFSTLLWAARDEDLGTGDITGRLLPARLRAVGRFVARQPLICCGADFLDDTARAYDELIESNILAKEGQVLEAGDVMAEWRGPAWAILAAERVALNFLQRLSGIATTTRQFVNAVAGTDAEIFDTRKTTPGWRHLEKYAVRVGGGKNHRRGLYDAVMVKDNHLAALVRPGEANALEKIGEKLRELREGMDHHGFIEVEIDHIEQLPSALKLPVDVVLLDNMMPDKLRQAVRLRDEAGLKGKLLLEASGGITLENVVPVARTGVERIAVGAVTHSARAVDIGLDVEIQSSDD
jgi:nicotinate-nucleotide pyrophosphorylase (carboxylating)